MDPIRIIIRHPDGQRDVRLIARTSTVTSLYCLVRDALFEMTQATERDERVNRLEYNELSIGMSLWVRLGKAMTKGCWSVTD